MKVLLKGFLLVVLITGLAAGGLYLVVRLSTASTRARTVAGTSDPRGLDAAGRTPKETRAVGQEAASGKREEARRAAADGDATDSESRRELEGLYSDYHPYFVRGDLDGDGRLDFAQAFVIRRNGGLWFDVAVFFGRDDGTFAAPVFVEREVSLAGGDLSIERSILIVTPDVSLDEARRWRFEPVERRFVDADAAPPSVAPQEGDAPEESPDDHPRARV